MFSKASPHFSWSELGLPQDVAFKDTTTADDARVAALALEAVRHACDDRPVRVLDADTGLKFVEFSVHGKSSMETVDLAEALVGGRFEVCAADNKGEAVRFWYEGAVQPLSSLPGADERWWPFRWKLRSLEPVFREKVLSLFSEMEAEGYQPYVLFGWRSLATQRRLHSRGRSTVRLSMHNGVAEKGTPSALAADIIGPDGYGRNLKPEDVDNAPLCPGTAASFFRKLGEAAEARGLTWGGRWRNPWDPAHVQSVSIDRQQAVLASTKRYYSSSSGSAV